MSKFGNLTTVSFQSILVGDAAIAAIAPAIAHWSKLGKLKLSCCRIGNSVAAKLASYIGSLSELTELDL